MKSIAIAITTRNRKEIFDKSLEAWEKYLPENAKIFIVDDASKILVKSDFRFETQQGIAKAKNKALELAQDFDHIFLVDDDVRPKVMGWELPYINSGINHLCLTFDKNSRGQHYSPRVRKNGEYNGLFSYDAPNGCFLYLKKICLEKAGGMRPEFGLWGFEHVEYSSRIYALGLTPKPFLDVPNSLDLIEVLDFYGQTESALSGAQKMQSMQKNLDLYEKYIWSKDYVPLIEY